MVIELAKDNTSRKRKRGEKPEDIIRELDACLQCGYCRSVCPVYEELPWESSSPRGKVFYLKQLYRRSIMDDLLEVFGREVKFNKDFAEKVYWCTSCGACEVACHVEIAFPELWEDVKEWAVENYLGPLKAHKAFLKRIKEKKNPFDEDPATRGDWAKGLKLSPDPEVIYFVGCTESFRMQKLAQATAEVLRRAGVRFNIMGEEEWCCTSPLLRTGQRTQTKSFAQHTRDEMKKWGAKVLVTACAGCYATTKRDHQKAIGEHPFEVMHISQYVERLLNEGRLKFNKRIDRKVTYHDPCHLGRHLKVFEAPRNVLKAIPGIELVEMPRNRLESRCCGAGAGFKAQFNEHAENIAVGRVKEAVETGAEEIITTCPFCNVNLNAGAKKAGIDIKTKDLLQLLLETMG